jgi:hypothetical protein
VQLEAIAAAAEAGLKDHDRWQTARTLLARKLDGRRSTSRLPALLDKVLFRVDAKTYDGLIAYLDEPPSVDANLRKLMQTTPPWQG